MALKQKLESPLERRFREFDEARVYIEEWERYHFEEICLAIDYMLVHKEYYYLLKTLYSKRFCDGVEEVADYLFSRLDCLSREEDKEMIFKFIASERAFLQEKALVYMLGCCEAFDLEKVYGIIPLTSRQIQLITEFGECVSVRKLMKKLQVDYKESLGLIEKFFEVYGISDVE